MSVLLKLTGHYKDLGGGFIVRRLLPATQKAQTMGQVPGETEFIPLPERSV